ncbi:DUF1580 domain-containing protein [Hymenobacter sp. BT662]|uniref:DUF1580 domain-containing protein n=1 Tax=Hymenobacter ruricola TaxID=2791023 RepID=A0ABS0IA80_9BACT|nr:DUF1580 domain-containing protein [Hymenobacter ruricola]
MQSASPCRWRRSGFRRGRGLQSPRYGGRRQTAPAARA